MAINFTISDTHDTLLTWWVIVPVDTRKSYKMQGSANKLRYQFRGWFPYNLFAMDKNSSANWSLQVLAANNAGASINFSLIL